MNINHFLESCIYFSIILSCFDGLNISSGLMQQGFLYPTLLGMICFFLLILKNNQKISIDILHKKYAILMIYICFSAFLNLDTIIGVEYKGFTAERRMLGISIILIFLGAMLIYYYNILIKKDNIISWIYKAFIYNFGLVSIYSIIQILGMFELSDIANNIYHILQPYINIQLQPYELLYPVRRVIGYSKEGSCFGNNLSVIFPWLMMGVVYLKKNNIIIFFLFLLVIFTIFSYSRIAYFCILLEFFCMIVFIKPFRKKLFTLKSIFFISIILSATTFYIINSIDIDVVIDKITGVFLSFSDEAEDNRMASNLTRLGLQYAAMQMFIDHPLIGVGIGQYQFNAVQYIPLWSYLSIEIQRFLDPGDDLFYGSFNTHLRILAETGIIGFILWISLALHGLKNYLYILKHEKNENKTIIKLIIISYIASFVGFMNFDIFEFFYYWLLLILSSVLVYRFKHNNMKI